MSFQLKYELSGSGWADATVADGPTCVVVTASYLTDALGDLARSAVAVLHGADDTTVRWAEEPGEYRWRFLKTNDHLEVRIIWFQGGDGILPDQNSDPYPPDEEGSLLFSSAYAIHEFVTELVRQLDEIEEQFGHDGYRQKWVEHDFPAYAHEQLRAWLQSHDQLGNGY